jgi:hypothetical protein
LKREGRWRGALLYPMYDQGLRQDREEDREDREDRENR